MLLLPFLALAAARSALAHWRPPAENWALELVLSIGFISLGVLFGILRNIPAFAFLAPGGACWNLFSPMQTEHHPPFYGR